MTWHEGDCARVVVVGLKSMFGTDLFLPDKAHCFQQLTREVHISVMTTLARLYEKYSISIISFIIAKVV